MWVVVAPCLVTSALVGLIGFKAGAVKVKTKPSGKKCLGYGGNFCFVLKFLVDYPFTFVVAGQFVDLGFDDLHVAFVVEVFLVFVHVDGEALSFFHEVSEVLWHCWG